MRSYYYITGTSRGIGRALTEELLGDEDALIFGIGRSPGPKHANYQHVSLDLSALDVVSSFTFVPLEDAQRVVLVNNAGTLLPKFLGNETSEAIINAYALNAVAPVLLMNAFIATYRTLAIQRTICNLSSIAASTPIAGAALYCGTKAALEMTSRVAALELEANFGGVQVLSVDPGAVDTDMQATLRGSRDEDFPGAERNRRVHAEGRLGSPQLVAKKLAELLRNPSLAGADSVRLGDSAVNH